MFHFFFVVVASLISVVGFDDADDKMEKFACVVCTPVSGRGSSEVYIGFKFGNGTFLFFRLV